MTVNQVHEESYLLKTITLEISDKVGTTSELSMRNSEGGEP